MSACPRCHAVNAANASVCAACGSPLFVAVAAPAATARALPPLVQAAAIAHYVAGGLILLGTLVWFATPEAGYLVFLPVLALLLLVLGPLVALAGWGIDRGSLAGWIPMVIFFGFMALGSALGLLKNDISTAPTLVVGGGMLALLLWPDTLRHVGVVRSG